MELQEQKELTRKNLIRVLEDLPKLAEKHPEIKMDFDMGIFGVYDDLKKENLNKCRTNGCLLGNAARIFFNEFTDDLFVNNNFFYLFFGNKFFPYLKESYGCKNKQWNYLFHSYWAVTKFNNLDSSLQRIENLLANDLECNKFNYKTNQIVN